MSARNNRGALYPQRQPHPDGPAWRGPATVSGRPYRVTAWERREESGRRVLHLCFLEEGFAAPHNAGAENRKPETPGGKESDR